MFIYELFQTNMPPDTPTKPLGPGAGMPDVEYGFESFVSDPEGEAIYYMFDWGDNTNTGWLGPVSSETNVDESNTWDRVGEFDIKIKAKDENGIESDWSEPSIIIISNPPYAPFINGPSKGSADVSIEFGFASADPDDDDIAEYVINWGDNTGEEIVSGPFASGEEAKTSHVWTEDGNYVITAKAKDINGIIGPESTITINIPRNRMQFFNLLQVFLHNHPDLFPYLQKLVDMFGQLKN
jgi:hypothetical protein